MQTIRITPPEVKAAYEKTGWRPRSQCTVYWPAKECCGLAALAIAAGVPANETAVRLWADWTFGGDYSDGFMRGFDGYRVDAPVRKADKVFAQGFDDGHACAVALGLSQEVRQ
jgi:hypothetical protein